MNEPVLAPRSDDLIDRQQFYATVAIICQSNNSAIKTIGGKYDDLAQRYERVHETVHASETRNKTLIKTAIVIWAIVGSGIGYYLEHSIEKFDAFVDRVNLIEKTTTAMKPDVDKIRDMSDKVDAMKRITIDLQRQLDDTQSRSEQQAKRR
jgi:hypothetical protein